MNERGADQPPASIAQMAGAAPANMPEQANSFQFAPNLSVYVLPPDAVCLYSEDRKFFLYGAIYCVLAERIGAGERRKAIVRALARNFSAETIDEAFKRLIDRRFIVPADTPDGTAPAYWASLGLKPELAAENLRKVRVRIQSLGAAGESELDAALRDLGVRVVDRAADLVVVLANDYLEAALAELNANFLAKKQDWLLVQLCGQFPLVGPIFSPGKSACWRCLADRMKWNRQIKAFLERGAARLVAVSPLTQNLLGRSAIGLAAVEIGKAIASGFRTDLHQHMVSLDLLGSLVARHYVPARPQCPICGSQGLSDPQRAPTPIALSPGGDLVLTSGGYRGVTPAATVARVRKHVSPLTGVVTGVERMITKQPLDASFIAKHNFSGLPETIDALHMGLGSESYGKGSTAEQGEASALMEAVERYSGIFQGNEIRKSARFNDFAKGEAIPPNDLMRLSDAQFEQAPDGKSCSDEVGLQRFDPTAELEWSPAWSLRDETFRYVPTGLAYFFHKAPGAYHLHADSNGCAAGNTLEEAILQGFLELVERDAYAIWWYNRLRRPEVALDELGDSYVRDLRAAFAAMGRKLWALDVTGDLGIPVVVAVSHWIEDGEEKIEFGAGAHFDLRIAALRALTEINQFLAIDQVRGRGVDGADALPIREHAYVRPHGKSAAVRSPFAKFASLDRAGQVMTCVKLVKRLELDFLVLDQTRPDIGIPVVRVIVPGLRHYYRRFGPGRTL